jgi:hypothetical protein
MKSASACETRANSAAASTLAHHQAREGRSGRDRRQESGREDLPRYCSASMLRHGHRHCLRAVGIPVLGLIINAPPTNSDGRYSNLRVRLLRSQFRPDTAGEELKPGQRSEEKVLDQVERSVLLKGEDDQGARIACAARARIDVSLGRVASGWSAGRFEQLHRVCFIPSSWWARRAGGYVALSSAMNP